ncbi:hypothetical protein [Aquabacterium sp.]|uniref:tetratricopeptide repeat protein n=1 Tax=Aquabacterium sp. TaxID=1872578 RepID=UPI00248A14D4|nr:hypothetical protein [Aquabacterium sp.]MDI1349939.1 hypothetical protein [Aquabacterium sp.]
MLERKLCGWMAGSRAWAMRVPLATVTAVAMMVGVSTAVGAAEQEHDHAHEGHSHAHAPAPKASPVALAASAVTQPRGKTAAQRKAELIQDPRRLDPGMMSRRADLLAQAEGELAQGHAQAAEKTLDRAAGMLHAADTEMGLVRAYMQAGDYRRALSFAAHTAGAHPEDISGLGLYAWLLHLGGQPAVARQLLDQTLTQVRPSQREAPSVRLLAEVSQRLQAQRLALDGAMLQPPMRLAPMAHGAVPAEQARVAGAAWLLPDGQHALVPLAAMPLEAPGTRLWLRNGLGRTVQATPEKAFPDIGLRLVHLREPLADPKDEAVAALWQVPARDAFPGTPAVVMSHARSAQSHAAWPLLSVGFLGAPVPAPAFEAASAPPAMSASPAQPAPQPVPVSWRRLGIPLPEGQGASPVLDMSGRLLGLAVPVPDGAQLVVPISRLRQVVGERFGPVASEPTGQRQPVDQLYEGLLRATLQAIVAPPLN